LNDYNKLIDTTRQLSEVLNLAMPELPVDEDAPLMDTVIDEFVHDEKSCGIWEDEETQR